MDDDREPPDNYALGLANGSYAWYSQAAIRSRRAYKMSETSLLGVTAAVPVSAVIWPDSSLVPALFGSAAVFLAGLRAIFHWHDNYMRFTAAREAVEAERRRYRTGDIPYGDPTTRDRHLAEAVTRIEQLEMSAWIRIVANKSRRIGDEPEG